MKLTAGGPAGRGTPKSIPTGFYRLPAEGVPMTSEGLSDSSGPPEVGPRGEHVPALLDYFLRRDRKRFFACVEAMKQLIPGMEELEISTPNPVTRRVDLVVE